MSLYGDTVGAKRTKELVVAMQSVAELPADEQYFVLAHLGVDA
jgi:hypothetical protein